MSANFDPRSPSTSYAGSAPGTPLNPIQNSNIPSVGSTGVLNSPLRPASANPAVHRIQKSAGVKQLYTSDWCNGAYQTNPGQQVPSRAGSTVSSVWSDMTSMSKTSHMSGMSQFSTLSVNTNLSGFNQFYAQMPVNLVDTTNQNDPKQHDEKSMNQLVEYTEDLLKNNRGDEARTGLVDLSKRRPQDFYLPRQEALNQLFLSIFNEIPKVCKSVSQTAVNVEQDERLRQWIYIIMMMYSCNIKPAKNAIDKVITDGKSRPVIELCNFLLPNRRFSLLVVSFISESFRRRSIRSAIKNSALRHKAVFQLMNMAKDDATKASIRATAILAVRRYISQKNEFEVEFIEKGIVHFSLSTLLSKELDEPVIHSILKLLTQLILETHEKTEQETKTIKTNRYLSRKQFYDANGIEILCNLMRNHSSNRVIEESLTVIAEICKHDVPIELIPMIISASSQVVGGKLLMTGSVSEILSRLARQNNEMVFKLKGVETALHILFACWLSFDPYEIHNERKMQNKPAEINTIREEIDNVASNCLLTLQTLGNLKVNQEPYPQFMDRLYHWRFLNNEKNPSSFDVGTLLLVFLSARVKLRPKVLQILKCLCTNDNFKELMLDVRGGQFEMELSQLLIAIIYKNYAEYDKIAKKETLNIVTNDCWSILLLLIREPLHLNKVMTHLTMDCRNSQRREPLTLLMTPDKDRDTNMLKFVEYLVKKYPEAVSIFNSQRQIEVVNDLSVNIDAEIQALGCSIRAEILKCPVISYPQGFHSLTPQDTPNYGYMPNSSIYSDYSDSSPNLNQHHNYN